LILDVIHRSKDRVSSILFIFERRMLQKNHIKKSIDFEFF
jgi:hypothetical protein